MPFDIENCNQHGENNATRSSVHSTSPSSSASTSSEEHILDAASEMPNIFEAAYNNKSGDYDKETYEFKSHDTGTNLNSPNPSDNKDEFMVNNKDDECCIAFDPGPRKYELLVGTIENKVAFGRAVAEGDAGKSVHGGPLQPGHVRISVDGVLIQGDASVPVLIVGEIKTVCQAVGSYVAWPRDLITFIPIVAKGCPKQPGGHECGYVVMCYMKEIIEDMEQKFISKQKRRFRYKLHSKRKVNFNEEGLEDQFPKKSTFTTTQTSMPSVAHEEFKIDPSKNFHGEPIIPKDEPIDWDSLPIPELNLPHFMKPKKTKTRAVKKVKPSTLRSKPLTKAQTKVNKGDIMYICDIKEFSDLNLYVDELEEVRGIYSSGMRLEDQLEDQLSISSNETLLEMQGMLNLSESDELEFHKQLQNQIEENNRRLGKKSIQSRK
ncbi:hypothetical protein AgCh_034950 [Apium graveolens]